ncbi:transposase, partial [Leptospira mayottensis]
EVIDTLKDAVPEYNSRPSGVLFGFSPLQVLNGEVPDKYRFVDQIKEAASRDLISTNKIFVPIIPLFQ